MNKRDLSRRDLDTPRESISSSRNEKKHPQKPHEPEKKTLSKDKQKNQNISRTFHHGDHPGDEIGNVLERSRLLPVAVHRHRLARQRLRHEVAHHAPVVERHARAVGVEDAAHAHVEPVLAAVVEGQTLGRALALVVAGALADRVDVAPVGLRLRVLERVAVDLGGGGEEEAGAGALMLGVKFFGGKEEQRAKREK